MAYDLSGKGFDHLEARLREIESKLEDLSSHVQLAQTTTIGS